MLVHAPSVQSLFSQQITNVTPAMKQRNVSEMLILARIIDELRLGRVKTGMELAVRRIIGVQAAEKNGSWQVCDTLTGDARTTSFLPESFAKHTIKRMNLDASLNNKSAKDKYSSSSGTKFTKRTNNPNTNSGRPTDRRSDQRPKTESTADKQPTSNKGKHGHGDK